MTLLTRCLLYNWGNIQVGQRSPSVAKTCWACRRCREAVTASAQQFAVSWLSAVRKAVVMVVRKNKNVEVYEECAVTSLRDKGT